MNTHDINKLIGLLSKLDAATTKAASTDGSFQKHYSPSMNAIKHLPNHIKKLEQGLKTARILKS